MLHPTPPRGLYLKLDTEGDPDAKQLREGDWVDVQSKEFWPGRWHAGKVMAFHSDGKIVVIKCVTTLQRQVTDSWSDKGGTASYFAGTLTKS